MALAVLDANSMNAIVEYCKTRGIVPQSFTEIWYGDGGGDVNMRIGRAAQIAERFGTIVHLSHFAIPITCHPTVRDAALDGYRVARTQYQAQQQGEGEGEA